MARFKILQIKRRRLFWQGFHITIQLFKHQSFNSHSSEKTEVGLLQKAQNHSASHLEQIRMKGGMKRVGMTFASHPSEFVFMRSIWLHPPRLLPVMELEQPTLSAASHIGLPGTTARQRSCQDWECTSPKAKAIHVSKAIWH